VVGNASNTWVGSSSTSITNRAAWGISPPSSAPSDRYVLFNGVTASNRTVNVDGAANLRGLYFRTTTNSSFGFTFSGAGILTVGRGGLVNYDVARQTFTANLALGDHQYWDGGAGGITISNVNSGGKLLEITLAHRIEAGESHGRCGGMCFHLNGGTVRNIDEIDSRLDLNHQDIAQNRHDIDHDAIQCISKVSGLAAFLIILETLELGSQGAGYCSPRGYAQRGQQRITLVLIGALTQSRRILTGELEQRSRHPNSPRDTANAQHQLDRG